MDASPPDRDGAVSDAEWSSDSAPADAAIADGDSPDGAACAAPSPPYGTSVGDRMEPFVLQRCDGTDYALYGPDFCDATLTVINIVACWSPPSIRETSDLEAQINDVYASRGVRVIQILVQDEDYSAPTLDYCSAWVSRFGLTNIELIDPAQVTQIYFPGNVLPVTLIVDAVGTIRFKENGATEGLSSLRARLDELLP